MRIVTITSGLSVNPEFVASVEVLSNYDKVRIRMNDGTEHHVERRYKESVRQTHDYIIGKLKEAGE